VLSTGGGGGITVFAAANNGNACIAAFVSQSLVRWIGGGIRFMLAALPSSASLRIDSTCAFLIPVALTLLLMNVCVCCCVSGSESEFESVDSVPWAFDFGR